MKRREYAALHAVPRNCETGDFFWYDDRVSPRFLRNNDGEVG